MERILFNQNIGLRKLLQKTGRNNDTKTNVYGDVQSFVPLPHMDNKKIKKNLT